MDAIASVGGLAFLCLELSVHQVTQAKDKLLIARLIFESYDRADGHL